MKTAAAFELPAALEAHEPAEARGIPRDGVRMLVATRRDGGTAHARFADLPGYLEAGDLLVVNTSATVPAAVDARRADGAAVELRFAMPAPELPDGRWWVVELRADGGATPLLRGVRAGERIALPGDAAVELHAPYARSRRLWLARLDGELPLARHGRPVRYGYVPRAWPLSAYQTVFALQPGSAEMASAARPFTHELVATLVAGGVLLAPVVLHAGLSSPERGEPPLPERFVVPEATARLVAAVRGWGGRVVAVGTTAARALESAAGEGGGIAGASGVTRLVITPQRGVRVIDGLLTGWHEPQASHLDLLEAVAGPELLERSYSEALAAGYKWHEFGDSHLILP